MESRFNITFPLVLESDGSFRLTFTLEHENRLECGSGLYYLYGDNGSGKTTFLNMLALLAGTIGKKPGQNSGQIEFNGESYNGNNFNHIRAAEIREHFFCIFPQKAFFLPVSSRDNYIILNGSDRTQAESFSPNDYPDLLSGGQQQKILMDIVLDEKKPVWFLDEPLSNLDAERRHYFWKTLERAYRRELSTIFFIDHWMGPEMIKDGDFRRYNTLRASAETFQRREQAEIEFKSIEVYENSSPEKFFSKQIENIEKERSSGK
jgi:ABC-type lipoprotein export system ATPase subunit